MTRVSDPTSFGSAVGYDVKQLENIEGFVMEENLKEDVVNHPKHYTSLGAVCSKCAHPIECIDVTERMGFCIGNAVKYLWRAGAKEPDKHIEDLKKAIWYIDREIANMSEKP